MRVACLGVVAAILLILGREAAAELRLVDARAELEPTPRVVALVEVTPTPAPRPADGYRLSIDDPEDPVSVRGSRRAPDPRPRWIVFVIDASQKQEASRTEAFRSGADRSIEVITSSLRSNTSYGMVLVGDAVRNTVGPGEHARLTPVPATDRATEGFNLDLGLREALQLFGAAPAGARLVMVLISAPRAAPSPDLVARLGAAGVEVFTLELATPLAPALTRSYDHLVPRRSRRKHIPDPAGMPDAARLLAEDLSSVYQIEFEVPAALFDGRRRELTLEAANEKPFTSEGIEFARRSDRAAQEGGGLPWLWIVAVGSGVIALAGVLLLLRHRRSTAPAPLPPAVKTLPLPQPTIPIEEPEADPATYAPAPPGFAAWLYGLEGRRKGQTLPLRREGVTYVGSRDAHIIIDDAAARPRHARLIARGGSVIVEAVPAGQTVSVDGKELERERLRDGAVLQIGQARLLFKATT